MSPQEPEDVDLQSVYSQFCFLAGDNSAVIIQNTQRLSATDDLFHTDVVIQDAVKLRAMLDSGSMACSLSARALPLLKQNDVIPPGSISPTSVVLVGCGGSRTNPVGVCELQMRVFGCCFSVPTFIVEGQGDDLILGSNVMKHFIRVLKHSKGFGEGVSPSDQVPVEERNLLQLLNTVETWRGDEYPDKVGTVKLKHAVTLEPLTEHLVWGRLPTYLHLSAGSTVVVEPSESRTVPRSVMVGRVVTPLWGDGWVPVRVINPSTKPVTLRRNCKIADVSPCVALEDFDTDYLTTLNDSHADVQCSVTKTADESDTASEKSLTDAFRLSCDPLNRPQYRPLTVAFNSAAAVPQCPPISSKAVSAVLECSLERDCLPSHAFCLPQLTQSLLPSELPDFRPLPKDKLTSLQQAVRIAQISTTKQQQKQTELYNRKVRGAPVEVGDRVLLANKGERGRKKLTDRWESHLYTVVGKQDNTHTFRLRNCATSQEKVVHRNLIMPVNFLPVPADPAEGGSFDSSLTDLTVDESVIGAESDGSTVLPGSGPRDRTVCWISQLPVSQGDQTANLDDRDGHDQPGSDTLDQIDPDDQDGSRLDSSEETGSDDLNQSNPCGLAVDADCSGDLPDSQPAVSILSVDLLPADAGSVVASEAGQNLSYDSLPGIRTRYGRVVRPVVRLIRNMRQKVLAGR
ncbi:hypothetical protein N1851_013258 [Merluccius polli]|uniref:Uncharacterized protein n=1 Tax=Merluccius polli TaxID=89951 RepID=A0AA47P5E9_MERPO|nr:hypothetical protein N1851_013258 [Merluccius polli]